MASLSVSEANYSLVLDYPLPSEQAPILPHVPEQENLPPKSSKLNTLTLYQRNYSSRNDSQADQLDPSNSSNFEVEMYQSRFQKGMFLRSFFISIFNVTGLGMLLSIILRPCHSNFYKNYFVYSDNPLRKVVGIQNLLFMALLIRLHLRKELKEEDENFNVITLFHMMVIFSITSAAREAFCHRKLVEILKTKKLGEKSLDSTRFKVEYPWNSDLSLRIKELERNAGGVLMREEKEKVVKELEEYEMTCAIQTTISRLKIDMSLYYLSFFDKTPANLLRRLKQREDLTVIEKGDFVVSNEQFSEPELLRDITKFEHDIFEYKYCTEPSQYDKKKAYGYSLALDLLLNKKPKTFAATKLIWIFVTALLVFNIIPSFFLTIEFSKAIQDQVLDVFIIIFYISFIGLPYANVIYFINQGIKIMTCKYIYMQELKELISTETQRLDEKDGDKSYPTLNILDFKSLESWMRLRKIFMNLYDEKLQGIILAVALVMILELVFLMAESLIYVSIHGVSSFILMRCGLRIMFYLTVFVIFAYYAARVNSQFKVHKDIILANQQIVCSLYKYYSDFVGENALKPGTYIYSEGLKFLRKEYGGDLTVKIEKKMKKEYKKVGETYESVLRELDNEELRNPIRILGLPITKTVVKSFGAVLVSISMPVIKQGITSLFHK